MILLYILYALCPEQYKQIYCMRLLSSVISDKRQMHKKAIYVLNYLFTRYISYKASQNKLWV